MRWYYYRFTSIFISINLNTKLGTTQPLDVIVKI